MSHDRITIVGMACRYPDADSPEQLWENVLAGRRAFRRLPDERMNADDYYSADPAAPDRFYSRNAAVLRGYRFDRARFRIAGSTYRATDLTHWLALETAERALADAGFPGGEGLPRKATTVVIGNSLTGEFTRANLMRLRWPYVRRTVAAALAGTGWSAAQSDEFLRDLEVRYKAPFPAVDEDSLAGGLANTIAGRICNHFDLGGGGYTVDGACSSSLLSVATGAKALLEGDVDVAVVGGVDLSIDPFEVIGFAKTGALATGEMRVYDRESNGFWPGEGCGMLVLMRESDALAGGRSGYASLTGWGVSSDGSGGITRPESEGHQLAVRRAYARAGYGVDTVSYFEGHGTGTAVGDATEIAALSAVRRAANPSAPPAALGTVKGNIGHTKAAAGVAGLIKATLAVHHQTIPPGTGHREPHPSLLGDAPALRVPAQAALWPADQPVRAGVSAMGFGGINTHIAIEQTPQAQRRTGLARSVTTAVAGRQDAELLLVDGPDAAAVRARLTALTEVLALLSQAELADLAGTLAAGLTGGPARAAVVAATPEDAVRRVHGLLDRLDGTGSGVFDAQHGVFFEHRDLPPRIALLFPGQGSGRGADGAIRHRFPVADDVFRVAGVTGTGDQTATEVAQPRIVAGSLAAVRVLDGLGVHGDLAVGHSLGELTALSWGGAMDGGALLRLAAVRGAVMARASHGGGAMAGLGTDAEHARRLVAGHGVVIAGYNGPGQTVVSGPADAVAGVCAAAEADGVTARRITVSHAFHSPLVRPAADQMAERLAEVGFQRLHRDVVSTVTGELLKPDVDVRALLRDQVLLPVRFHQAAAAAADGADLVLELGPGRVLTDLVAGIAPGARVLAVDTDSRSLVPLLTVVGAAFAAGARIDTAVLFAGRVWRELPLRPDEFEFLTSPCETAPSSDVGRSAGVPAQRTVPSTAQSTTQSTVGSVAATGASTLELLRRLAAERVELPVDTVTATTHPLDDLHLSSITVGQLVNQATTELGRPALASTTNFAVITLGELAELIDDLAETDHGGAAEPAEVPGVAPWVRPFEVRSVARPLPGYVPSGQNGSWQVVAAPGDPLAERAAAALAEAGVGDGVLLCVPYDGGEDELDRFLAAARLVLAAPAGTRFVVAQDRLGASGLARTLALEAPRVPVTVVRLADRPAVPVAVERIVAETRATTGFTQVCYAEDGTRTVPVLTAVAVPDTAPSQQFGRDDVLLVTGGGKGITAECALAVAADTGAALGLLGRADPGQDAELAANLARFDAAGVRHHYVRADVTSPEQVRTAVRQVAAELGPVTGVLHGAGLNQPCALTALTEQQLRRTVAPKTGGLRAVLDAVGADAVKLLITFGSIIGRAGLRGEAHYATANDWMSELTEQFQREHPGARALAVEWSVWSGAGMGERLGVVEALTREGITPISTDEGIAVLRRLLADPSAGPVVVVSGRAAGLPTLELPATELPLTRFVDRVVVHYPGVELVTEAELTADSDLYLADHLLDGDLLFPAVLGMEAMTQVAAALTGRTGSPVLTDVEFLRPIAVRPGGATRIRVAALARDDGRVEVVVRSAETGFGADHFRAVLGADRPQLAAPAPEALSFGAVPMDPVTELYGGVLFQGKRFQRLCGYRVASARRAVAEVSTISPAPWFAPFLPQELVLADPGTRDTVMHALQCCVPDAILLPQRIERLVLAEKADQNTGYVLIDAREREQHGDSYTYDVDVFTPSGTRIEHWQGLTLRAVRKRGGAGPWVPALLGSYLERAIADVLGGARSVVLEPDPVELAGAADRRGQTALAASRSLGRRVLPRYRPDGRPELDDTGLSASHTAGLTMVVTGAGRLGCDAECARPRTEPDWAGLLGRDPLAVRDLVRGQAAESADVAGTRVWGALECLRKNGSTTTALTVDRVGPDGWVVFAAGADRVASWVTTVTGVEWPVVFTVLSEKER